MTKKWTAQRLKWRRLLVPTILLILGLLISVAPESWALGDTGDSTPTVVEEEAPRKVGKDGVMVVHLTDKPIISAVERYMMTRLDQAEEDGIPYLLVIDTPGGAVDTTRSIVKRFLGSSVPILVWVGPPGARAGSAGVFITMAANIASMAPGTNIGAAHPIGAGVGAPRRDGEDEEIRRSEEEVMAQKIENDLIAFAEALAKTRGRNIEWAISAVKESASVPADKALELGVVDLINPDIDSFLAEIDGRIVETATGKVQLETKGAQQIESPMTLREEVQMRLGDPSIAYLLMSLGMMGIVLELYNPGMMIGGILGGICLVLAAASGLPFSSAGLLLIAAAGVLFTLEVYVTSFGLLALSGSLCLVLGGIFLYEAPENVPAGAVFTPSVGYEALISVGLISLVMALSLAYMIGKAHLQPSKGGPLAVFDQTGEALTDFSKGKGQVFINGEYWKARSDLPIQTGDSIRVLSVNGLTLKVVPSGGEKVAQADPTSETDNQSEEG